MKIKSMAVGFALASAIGCHAATADFTKVIPLPSSISERPGEFKISSRTSFKADKANYRNLEFLKHYLGYAGDDGEKNTVRLKLNNAITGDEAYRITITPQECVVEGKTPAGVFYGIQTLRKSLDPFSLDGHVFPCVEIEDVPRFGYRGAMLDVARNFFTKEEVMRFIDQLALHNINRFHWHLSDDQGWRIEIKSRPELTEKASVRAQTIIGHNLPRFDGKPHGGFYTQDEIREIIAYAADRHITVIPEIDLPGHQQSALAAYPQLGCTGGPYDVWQSWGVSQEVLCAGNPETYTFLTDVLGEIASLFPSEMIHVGGDECPKVRWKNCPKCQAEMDRLGISESDGRSREQLMQTHVMEFVQDFLAQKGKRIIGWDEILEGGIGGDAVVMSWQGEEGGIAASAQDLDVIMAPNSNLYFDYFQTADIEHEPLGFTDWLPLKKVYDYNPVPSGLSAEEQKHIIGVQGCLWTAFIPTQQLLEYMSYPRMAALAEMQWCSPEKRDYSRFTASLPALLRHYRANGIDYSTRAFDVEPTFSPTPGGLEISLSSLCGAPVYYTLDGSEPNVESPLYTAPLKISETTTVRAIADNPNMGIGHITTEKAHIHKAFGKPVTIHTEAMADFRHIPASVLTDGIRGTANKKTGRWIGFRNDSVSATVDLQTKLPVSSVELATVMMKYKWILPARKIKVELSDDNVSFREAAYEEFPEFNYDMPDKTYSFTVSFPTQEARYVRVTAEPEKWHPTALAIGPSHLFLDEIAIE